MSGYGTDHMRDALLDSAGLGKIPPPEAVIDGLPFTDCLTWLTGKHGVAKPFIVIDMGGCVSLGLGWQGRPVKVVAEGAPGLPQRVRAWEQNARQETAVTFLPLAIRLPRDASALAEVASGLGALLIIIDTQARVSVGLDENSSRDMGQLIEALDIIREQTSACVLIVHHEARNTDTPCGHSAMDGAAGSLLRVN